MEEREGRQEGQTPRLSLQEGKTLFSFPKMEVAVGETQV